MFPKILALTIFVAVAHAGHLYSTHLLAPTKYVPIASSYQYETRVHSAPYITKYVAPVHKFAAPLTYAAPAVALTHHGYAHAPLLGPKFAAPLHFAGPALW